MPSEESEAPQATMGPNTTVFRKERCGSHMLCKKKTSGVSIDDTQRPVFRGGGLVKSVVFRRFLDSNWCSPRKLKQNYEPPPGQIFDCAGLMAPRNLHDSYLSQPTFSSQNIVKSPFLSL